MGGRFSKRVLAALALVCLLAGLTVATEGAGAKHHRAGRHNRAGQHHRVRHRRNSTGAHRLIDRATHPNIVFVLTDDLAMNLVQYMPNVLTMERQGLTFNDYFVSDSLCCPSRASIFSGNFPHDTGIYGNTGRHGGFDKFYARGEEHHTFATALHSAGYRTAMMGKYLNGYLGGQFNASATAPTYVPPGWDRWDVAGWGYPEFNYVLNENGALRTYGNRPSDYLTDVLSGKAVNFIDGAAHARRPFFLEVATFAPHRPYTPAPRNLHDLPGLKAPQEPNFDTLPANAPPWLASRPPLPRGQIDAIDRDYRKRAQAVEAVDGLIGAIQEALIANGIQGNTYIVFSSDNGLHMGEYRLTPGKMTAFDTDIHVPLIVTGPGVPARRSTDAMAENIDLAKTFAQIGGTDLSSDGRSLLPILQGVEPLDWRNAVLIEHRHPADDFRDPDSQDPGSGNPPTYEAMRTHDFLYVEYGDGERELYNLRTDPFELNNLAPYMSPEQIADFHSALLAMEHCHDGTACWAAMHVDTTTAPVRPRRP